MFKINPYRPGAGVRPQYLAGRDEDIENVTNMFTALTLNIPTQSVIFSGLRGVGKTVLINRLQEIAEEKNIFCKHIEVAERNDFISQIATCSQAFLRQISVKEKFKNLIKKPLDAIKSLVVSFDPNDNTFSLSLEEKDLYKTNNLTQSLTDVFTSLGEAAAKAEIPICFFIDEIQYIKSENLGALIAAIHRTNQLGYPIMIIAAGLPKIYSMLSSEKSYSERLFIYKEIDSLEREQAIKAIEMPIKQFNVKYSDKAINKIIEVTEGYPFFIPVPVDALDIPDNRTLSQKVLKSRYNDIGLQTISLQCRRVVADIQIKRHRPTDRHLPHIVDLCEIRFDITLYIVFYIRRIHIRIDDIGQYLLCILSEPSTGIPSLQVKITRSLR